MNKNLKYQFDFQAINSTEKAYVLGLIYSDGNVYFDKKLGNYKVSILLKREDDAILEAISNKFSFFTFKKGIKYSVIYCYSKEFCLDLINLGVLPRKSTENKAFLLFPEISSKYIPHFIRGLYDGDGGYYKKGHSVQTFFCTTSEDLIKSVQSYLKSFSIVSYIREVYKSRSMPIFWLRSDSKDSFIKFRDLIFKDSNFSLQRKKEIVMSYEFISNFKARSLGQLGRKHSEATKSLLKEQRLGKKRTKEACTKTSESLYKHYQNKYLNTLPKHPSLCCNYHTVKCEIVKTSKGVGRRYLCKKCNKKRVEYPCD